MDAPFLGVPLTGTYKDDRRDAICILIYKRKQFSLDIGRLRRYNIPVSETGL